MAGSTHTDLDRHRYINLATFRRNGRAVETPVWFALQAGKLYVFTEGDAGKVKRLRGSSRVRVAPCDMRGRVKGDWIEGEGRIVQDPTVVGSGYEALMRKYGWQMRVTNFFSRVSGRVKRRAMLELEV